MGLCADLTARHNLTAWGQSVDIQVGQHWRTRGGRIAEVIRVTDTGLFRYSPDWQKRSKVKMVRCRVWTEEYFVDDRGLYYPSDGDHSLDLVSIAATVPREAAE